MTLFTWNSRYGLPVRREGRFCAPMLVPGVYREQGGLFCAPMLVSGGYREQGRPFCAPMLVPGVYREQGRPFLRTNAGVGGLS